MQFTFAKKSLNFIYAFKCYQQIAIRPNVSWPHFSWPTLYLDFIEICTISPRWLRSITPGKCLRIIRVCPILVGYYLANVL